MGTKIEFASMGEARKMAVRQREKIEGLQAALSDLQETFTEQVKRASRAETENEKLTKHCENLERDLEDARAAMNTYYETAVNLAKGVKSKTEFLNDYRGDPLPPRLAPLPRIDETQKEVARLAVGAVKDYRSGEEIEYSPNTPTAPGWYWWRLCEEEAPTAVKIVDHDLQGLSAVLDPLSQFPEYTGLKYTGGEWSVKPFRGLE